MGKLHYNSGEIINLEIERVEESRPNLTSSFEVIHLTIVSEYLTIKYRVSGDANYTLDYIEQKLNEAKNIVMSSDKSLGINEYLERSYIYIFYPDGDMQKYTGQKL